MTGSRSRRAFQLFLVVLGSVAVVAGMSTVVLGVSSIAGAEEVSGTVDSEMRFYAVWYVGAGVVLFRSSAKVENARTPISGIALLLLLGGFSRALSWIVVGEPHVAAQVLMVIELTLPFLIVPWHRAVARATSANAG